MAISRNANTQPVTEANEDVNKSINNSRKISNKLDLLDQKIDSLYKDIYVSRVDNGKNTDDIISRLDDSIDSIQSSINAVSGMSELLRRLDNKSPNNSNVNKLIGSVSDMFNDTGVINALFLNEETHRYISSQNYQYDLICRYLPKLLDALEIKRDTVLCSDNFDKNFVNPVSNKTSKSESSKFSANTKKIEVEYEISKFFDKTYMNVSKYGEDFIYIVPYNVAFERIIRRGNMRRNTSRLGGFTLYESTSGTTVLEAGYATTREFEEYKATVDTINGSSINMEKFEGCEVKLHFNDSNIIESAMNERIVLKNKKEMEKFQSLASVFESFGESPQDRKLMKQYEKIKDENDGLTNAALYANSNDGLIIPGSLIRDPDKIDKDMLGAVVERLPRENIVPIYIGKVCMGYYYLDFAEDKGACGYCGGHHMTPGLSNASSMSVENSQDQQDLAIRYIASRLSNAIDTHFINANKDLKEEIYAVLRYNEKFDISRTNDIAVTFIPAEDIVHCYFELDEYTHRGISDLEKSIIPAMLYILLYLTDIIGKITRSADKRIYYVKQNVETNVARTMLNVVQQIKKGNFGMRQIESMNNILNIVGKYNDFIIPLGQSGDAPIQFEVMQGQDIQTPTDIMEKMEEAAVNATGVPFEMLNSIYQQDFAIRFSMSNTRFLKTIYTRQRDTQMFFSKIYTKIYNYEFGESNYHIDIILPPPIYMTMNNNQQLLDNVMQMAQKIADIELANEEETIKQKFIQTYCRNQLSAYFNYSDIDRYIEASKVEEEVVKVPEVEEAPTDGDDMSDLM